jgi:hypothetical protein
MMIMTIMRTLTFRLSTKVRKWAEAMKSEQHTGMRNAKSAIEKGNRVRQSVLQYFLFNFYPCLITSAYVLRLRA